MASLLLVGLLISLAPGATTVQRSDVARGRRPAAHNDVRDDDHKQTKAPVRDTPPCQRADQMIAAPPD